MLDEYARMREKTVDELNALGLFPTIHFDFDQAEVRAEDRPTLARAAETLRQYDFLVVTIEGHCDERGTVEYNLALGERRAQAAYVYLTSLGVSSARLRSVSYGKERPHCHERTAACWSTNRRAVFSVTGKTH